jgi:hypothetical protein
MFDCNLSFLLGARRLDYQTDRHLVIKPDFRGPSLHKKDLSFLHLKRSGQQASRLPALDFRREKQVEHLSESSLRADDVVRDYIDGGCFVAHLFFHPQPELDQAADGFGAAGRIVLLCGPFVDGRAQLSR